MGNQAQRDSEAPKAMAALNFALADLEGRDQTLKNKTIAFLNQYAANLTGASWLWMFLQLDSYTAPLKSRECKGMKIWKNFDVDDQMDVYLSIAHSSSERKSPIDLKSMSP